MFRLEPSVDRAGAGWIVGKEDVVLLGTAVGNSVSKKIDLQQH